MIHSEILAPGILLYEDVIDFSERVIKSSSSDYKAWNIKSQKAESWLPGEDILGYDEYQINFNFSTEESLFLLTKRLFDNAIDYSTKNLTNIGVFDSCVIRKYSDIPSFLELEAADDENQQRKVTSILFLNDLPDSGNIYFKNFDVSMFPKSGNAIVFPSSFIYSFKINKPKGTDNFVVVSHFV